MTRSLAHISTLLKKNRASGFTLVEVLLVMTIFAFIGLGIATSFFSGMKLWARATGADFWHSDLVLSLESVSKNLRQSLDVPGIGFEGDSNNFSFPALSGNNIIKASYSYSRDTKTLTRGESMMKDIIAKKLKIDMLQRDVLSLDEFTVQYLKVDKETKGLEWKDEWKKEDGIFAAIRFKGKSHNEEFQKTIFMPVSE